MASKYSSSGGHVNPTSVTDRSWVYVRAPSVATSDCSTFGKWLVFKPKNLLDEAWHRVRSAVQEGKFGDECTGAKCSTSLRNPTESDSSQGVFMVYTTKEGVDEVGLMLVHMVQQVIRYKTDEATRMGKYAHKGDKKVTLKAIYWNNGNPSFHRQ